MENIEKRFICGAERVRTFCGHLSDKCTNTSTALLLTCLTHAFIHNHDLGKTENFSTVVNVRKKFRWSIFRVCICLSTQTGVRFRLNEGWNETANHTVTTFFTFAHFLVPLRHVVERQKLFAYVPPSELLPHTIGESESHVLADLKWIRFSWLAVSLKWVCLRCGRKAFLNS